MFVHFRERIGKDLVNKVNLCMIKTIREQMEDEQEKNQGKLIRTYAGTLYIAQYQNEIVNTITHIPHFLTLN